MRVTSSSTTRLSIHSPALVVAIPPEPLISVAAEALRYACLQLVVVVVDGRQAQHVARSSARREVRLRLSVCGRVSVEREASHV